MSPFLRTVQATRFVQPLREGGSVPGLFEADDDGLYVVKLHGAAQGPKSLVAELITGEIARSVGLRVPDLVLVALDRELTRGELDRELNDHLGRAVGLNLGLDYLPGALAWAPSARLPVDPVLAADIVWLDAFTANVDRTTRNPNMLLWHDELWLIDHGASIYPHHRWADPAGQGRRPFPQIAEHVLLPVAGSLVEADARLSTRLDESLLWGIVSGVPDVWLPESDLGDADAQRRAYFDYFVARLQAPRTFVANAEQLRADASVGVIDPLRATRGRRRE